MNASTLGILLTCLLVTCHAHFISFDVKVAELSGGKEVNSEESEIFINEYYLPETPAIDLDYDGDEDSADDEQEDDFIGRKTFNMSDIDFQMSFGKGERRQPDEHMNFAIGFGQTIGNSPFWSEWTCCRRVVNIQSRQRVIQSPRMELEYKRCGGHFCQASMCNDNMGLCQHFMSSRRGNLCDPHHSMSTFMSHHCPQTCNFCGVGREEPRVPRIPSYPWGPHPRNPPRPTFAPRTTEAWWRTRRPPSTGAPYYFSTTTRPSPRPVALPWWQTTTSSAMYNSKLVKVTILSHDLNSPYPSYKFSINDQDIGMPPWMKIPENGQELSHFYLYREPTDTFRTAIRFCSSGDRDGIEIWAITKRNCESGWNEEFKLYGTLHRSKSATLYYVGNKGTSRWTSRVSTRFPSRGYTASLFFFYGPKPESGRPTPRPQPTFPFPSQPTPRPRPVYTTQRPYPPAPGPFPGPTRGPFPPFPDTTGKPPPVNIRRPSPGPQPTNEFNKNCLEAHNLFRAVHNVPLLEWSPELARTAQSWADQLKYIAPERPNELRQPSLRTRNWPHSDSSKGFRNRGDGENIAWDMSSDGSAAEESVLRWYSEIFYYNRNNPTRAPAPDKPVGHLTQMLWKDTTKLGCGVAKTTLNRGNYNLDSTWTVSHYSPGGNVRYGNNPSMTLKLYNEQVPDMRAGSCMTNSGACSMGNQCMAFGPSRGSCACTNNKAACRSNNGCIAWCKNRNRSGRWKEECQGNYECSCTDQGAVCK